MSSEYYRKRLVKKGYNPESGFGYKPINEYFDGAEGHHVDKINVVYIPAWLHNTISHKQSDNNKMLTINIASWDFMESSVL